MAKLSGRDLSAVSLLRSRLDPQREVEFSELAILSRTISTLESEGLMHWGSIREDAGCTAGPFEVVYNSVSSEMTQCEVKTRCP